MHVKQQTIFKHFLFYYINFNDYDFMIFIFFCSSAYHENHTIFHLKQGITFANRVLDISNSYCRYL